jgi:hypothetical protein
MNALYAEIDRLKRVNGELVEVCKAIAGQPKIIQNMMRQHGIVLDNHNNNMQKYAFTLYSIIAGLADKATNALFLFEEKP